MKKFLQRIFNYRVRALVQKEFRQIRRDRRLAISLILPQTLQLLLFGFALSATVSNIRLGVVDESRTPESRELIAKLTESRKTSKKPPSATACNAAAWLGMAAPTMIPKDATQNAYKTVARRKGVGSPARLKPK